MGTDRNQTETKKKQSFKDDNVCKHYLVYDCPHEMFVNQEGKTSVNSPIGPCTKLHSEAMKERLKADKDCNKFRRRYLMDLRALLQRLVDQNDVKAKSVKQKLKEGVTCTQETAEAVDGHIAAREMLVNEKMTAAERMAEEGNLDASQTTMDEAQHLAHQKYRLARLKEVAEAWVDELCDVCGMQISWRAVEELEARAKGRPHPHVPGSWHQGWLRVRQALADVNTALAELQNEEAGDKDVPKDVERSRSRDKSSKRHQSRDKERAPSRDGNKGRRSSSRRRARRTDSEAGTSRKDEDKQKDRDKERSKGRRNKERDSEKRGERKEQDKEKEKEKSSDKDKDKDRDKDKAKRQERDDKRDKKAARASSSRSSRSRHRKRSAKKSKRGRSRSRSHGEEGRKGKRSKSKSPSKRRSGKGHKRRRSSSSSSDASSQPHRRKGK